MNSPSYRDPVEAQFTEWHNPLDREQVVDLFTQPGGPPTRYRWKAGETRALPSAFDQMIQRVHNGQIVAGKAPLLKRVGSDDKLDPALDMFDAERKQAQAEQTSAALVKRAADAALLVAAAKVEDTRVATTKAKPTPGRSEEKV